MDDSEFGDRAVKQGYLTREQLQQALAVKTVLVRQGVTRSLADICVGEGLIPREQLEELGTRSGLRILVPGFDLIEKLGEGGMGVVYKARQVSLDRIVAVKILGADLARDKEFVKRFIIEARTAGKLRHEHIVSALDCGESDGRYYMVMEHVEGRPLDQILHERRRLPAEEALGIVRQVAEGLQYAWEHHIVHRDIKPQNIMITADGTAKICDLGLCRDVASKAHITMTGIVNCTPAYASPEQARGGKDLDTRSDIYSLGATLYHALAGEPPFSGNSPGDVIIKHATEKPKTLSSRIPGISPFVNQLVMHMLEKKPADRPRTPGAVAEMIREILKPRAPLPEPELPAAPRPALPPPSRRSWIVGLCAGVALLVAAGLFLAFREGSDPSDAKEKVAAEALQRAKDLLIRKQWIEAARACENALEIKPDDPEARALLDRIAEGRYADAMLRGEQNRMAKDWRQAIAAFREALEARPNDASARRGLSEIRERAMRDPVWFEDLGILSGHISTVTCLAFSPDGERLVSASDDQRARIWEVAGRKEVHVLVGHSDKVTSVAFSPDGAHVASGSLDKSIRLWDARTGRQTLPITGLPTAVTVLVYSADGRMLVSGGQDGMIRIWDASDGKELRSFKAHSSALTALLYLSDGRTIVSAGRDQSVKFWDVKTGTLLHESASHGSPILCLAASRTGRHVASGDEQGRVKIWDAAAGAEVTTNYNPTRQGVRALAFDPAGGIVASGGEDRVLRVREFATGRTVRELSKPSGGIFALAWNGEGTVLASGDGNATIALWGFRE